MTTWKDVTAFLTSEYAASELSPGVVRVGLEWPNDGRSHFVDVRHVLEPVPLIRLNSPIAEIPGSQLESLLQLVGRLPVPLGLARYTGPMENLDLVGITHLLDLETITGDTLGYFVDLVGEVADSLEYLVTLEDDIVSEQKLVELMKARRIARPGSTP